MIKAIIIDDEQHCIDRLLLLLKNSENVSIEASCKTVKEGIKAINDLQPELIFLDVQIHDRTGFDLLRECGKINFKIIFTTAYDKFAIQAIKFSAIDYLLKPIDEEELFKALDKVTDNSIDDTRRMTEVIENNLYSSPQKKRITVPTANELLFLEIDDIIRCQSMSNYTSIFIKDKQKIVVAKTLKEFDELLSDHNFCRIHASDLINMRYIKSYNKGKGGTITLTDGTELEVSTRKKEDFLKKMSSY